MSEVMKSDASDTGRAENNSSKQPSILNIKSMETNTLMRVESDILEPLTFSQSECVFELQPKGFLHPGSSVMVSLDVGSTDALKDAFPYANVGIHSLVRRAVLRTTAGRVINDTDDWNDLQAVRSMFVQNSINKEREQFLTGRQVDFDLYYDSDSDVKASFYGLGNGLELNRASGDVATSGREGLSSQPVIRNRAGPEFQLKLHDLFNYCRAGNQLPLFLLPNERVQVVLYWSNEAGDRLAIPLSSDGGGTRSFQIKKADCKFIADYTFYSGEIMEKFRDEFAQGLTFSYTDYLLSKQSVSQAGALNNVRNLGGNGMVVDSILWSMNMDDFGDNSLLGRYTGETPVVLGGAGNLDVNVMTTNLFVNSEFLYPQDLTNPARQFHNLKEAEGMVPFVSRTLYSGQGGEAMSDGNSTQFEGRGQSTDLSRKFFHQGFRTSGLASRVDNRGIDLHMSASMDAFTYTQRAWLEVKRYVVISDGHLETYFV
jgi:hypothetical protein